MFYCTMYPGIYLGQGWGGGGGTKAIYQLEEHIMNDAAAIFLIIVIAFSYFFHLIVNSQSHVTSQMFVKCGTCTLHKSM